MEYSLCLLLLALGRKLFFQHFSSAWVVTHSHDYGMSMAERALRICSCRPSGMRGTKTTHPWISVLTLSSIFSLSPKFSISLSAGYQICCPAGMLRVQQSSVTTWLNPHNLLVHHRTAKIFFWRYRPTKKLTQYFKSKWNIIK